MSSVRLAETDAPSTAGTWLLTAANIGSAVATMTPSTAACSRTIRPIIRSAMFLRRATAVPGATGQIRQNTGWLTD